MEDGAMSLRRKELCLALMSQVPDMPLGMREQQQVLDSLIRDRDQHSTARADWEGPQGLWCVMHNWTEPCREPLLGAAPGDTSSVISPSSLNADMTLKYSKVFKAAV